MSPTIQMLSLLLPFVALGAQSMAIQSRDNWAPKKYADCWSFNAPITATGATQDLTGIVASPANNQEWTEQVVRYNAKNSTVDAHIVAAPKVNITGTYNFYMEYCQPKNGTPKGIFQGIHGNAANAAYWDLKVDGDDHEYSFVDTAAKHGWASLIYDRLGVGRTDHPDGINIVQVGYEVAQAIEIGRLIRSGGIGNGVPAYDKIVALGHSFGSLILLGTAADGPDTYDAVVFTGAAGDLASQAPDAILGIGGSQVLIASTVNPDRFGSLSNDYTVTSNEYLNQQGFFHYPNYTQEAFETFSAIIGENSIGQVRTGHVTLPRDRSKYTKPTFVIAGQYDAPACLADCTITGLPFPDQVAAAKLFFPSVAADDFESYIVADTGHGINFHPTAQLAYEKILDFAERHV